MRTTSEEWRGAGLPGADLVVRGLEDLAEARVSAESLLVSIGAPKLQRLGIQVNKPLAEPEAGLWRLLDAEDDRTAHRRYNALVGRLVSFERALACVRT